MYLVVLDAQGNTRLNKNLHANADAFLAAAITPFLPNVVVACECVHTWYWLANLCAARQIPFVLGHAFGMRAVHAAKTKSDAHDAYTIARLLKGGNLPQAYPYPRERRSLRALVRPPSFRPPSRPHLRPRPHRPEAAQPPRRRQ
jgi:transposase